MLQLDGQHIELHSQRITIEQELATTDTSGNSSSTDAAETGIKAKTIQVNGLLPFSEAAKLSRLFAMAQALDGGARKIYRIANPSAEAVGVKQVKFANSVLAVEQEKRREWNITFQLQEHRSVPEKMEERLPKKSASQQGSTGQSAGDTEQAPPETEVELTGFLGVLKQADDALS